MENGTAVVKATLTLGCESTKWQALHRSLESFCTFCWMCFPGSTTATAKTVWYYHNLPRA